MDILISVTIPIFVTIIVFFGIAFAFRRGIVPTFLSSEQLGVNHQLEEQKREVDKLRKEVDKLTVLLDEERTQRTKVLLELAGAYREINKLKTSEESNTKRIKELESQLGIMQEGKVKVLGIWPHLDNSPLNQTEERAVIYNAGIDYISVSGKEVTKDRIFREFRRDGISILEIGAHGTPEGIPLADGLSEAGWWERVIRGKGRPIRVAVLLACHSDYSITDALLRAGVSYVIAVDGEVKDTTAVAYAKAFYTNYAEGLDVEQAHEYALLVIDRHEAEAFRLRKDL